VARASKAEIARRIEEVRPLVVECLSVREIRSATIKGTSWGAQVSISQLKRYVTVAHQQIKEAAQIDRKGEIGAAKLRLERVIAKAAARGDLRSELAAVKQLCELFGLEEPRRSEVALSGQIDIGAAREALSELLAREIAEGRYEVDEQAKETD
jgi:hypothetical protein